MSEPLADGLAEGADRSSAALSVFRPARQADALTSGWPYTYDPNSSGPRSQLTTWSDNEVEP